MKKTVASYFVFVMAILMVFISFTWCNQRLGSMKCISTGVNRSPIRKKLTKFETRTPIEKNYEPVDTNESHAATA